MSGSRLMQLHPGGSFAAWGAVWQQSPIAGSCSVGQQMPHTHSFAKLLPCKPVGMGPSSYSPDLPPSSTATTSSCTEGGSVLTTSSTWGRAAHAATLLLVVLIGTCLACLGLKLAGFALPPRVHGLLTQAAPWISNRVRALRQFVNSLRLEYREFGERIVRGVYNILTLVQRPERVPYSESVLPAAIREEKGLREFLEVVQSAHASNTLLPNDHPDVLLVRRVGAAAVEAVAKGLGGGTAAAEWLRKQEWAFVVVQGGGGGSGRTILVAPGGKVVIHTCLLDGHEGREALLMRKLTHEVAAYVRAQLEAERDTLQRNAYSL